MDIPKLFLASDAERRAKDKELVKQYMDHLESIMDLDITRDRRLRENAELHSGRWTAIENFSNSLYIDLGNERVSLGSGKLNHYPIIDRVSKSVVSDLITRPIIPVIRDSSSKARNHRERIRLEKVQSFFQNNVIQPALAQITMQYDLENGIQDAVSLPIEAQQQRGSDIEQRLRKETPEEIFTYLQRLSTPDELVSEALLKEGMRQVKAKRNFDIGAEQAVISGEEYYRLGIINKNPYMEALKPRMLTWRGSDNVEYVEDGQFAKYVQYLTPEDAITKYAYHLLKEDVAQLSDLYSEIPSDGYSKQIISDNIDRKLITVLADNPSLQEGLDVRTREGQERLKSLYSNINSYSREGFGIKETYYTWRWMRKVKFVTRKIGESLETFIRDEHYRKDPLAGDISVVEKVIPQTWSGVKLGNLYIDMNPIVFQYNNINDPFDVKLGIYGGRYNTLQNEVRNASLIDLGKPWQYKYNLQVKKMEEHQATDIGKIFLGTTTMIPKEWTWAQWYNSVITAKMAIISNHREGINNLDTSIFRSIDLSKTVDIQNDIRQLEYLENKIITSMYYSPQKIGEISQYATNRNTQTAIAGVDRQMFRFYNKNRQIKENVLNALLQLCLYAYKDNENVKNVVLDDFLKAHYEQNFNTLDTSNCTLSVVDDFKESEKLEQMRSLALTFLQNGMTASQLSALMSAESLSELQQFLEDIDKKIKEERDLQHQREEALLEKQRQSAEAQIQLQQQFALAEAEREREVKIRMAEINSLQMQNATDVNNNKINDALERTVMQIKADEDLKKMELDHNEKIVKMELDVEKMKIGSQKS